MQVFARARHIRMSPRKVRLVADLIRGLSAHEAQKQLTFSKKAASEVVLKLLNSAMANAEHNFKLNKDILRIATIMVDGGPTIKRFKPRAQGRSAPIRKRTSHITIVLEEMVKKESVLKSKIDEAKKSIDSKEITKKSKTTK